MVFLEACLYFSIINFIVNENFLERELHRREENGLIKLNQVSILKSLVRPIATGYWKELKSIV